MNLVDFQYLFDLKENFNNVSLQRFYKKYQRINIGSFHDFIIGHCVVGASFFENESCQIPREITTIQQSFEKFALHCYIVYHTGYCQACRKQAVPNFTLKC